jgi:lysozyme
MDVKRGPVYVVAAAVAALATPVVVHYEGEIRRGYRDPIGIVTACVGHTATAQMGRTYTAAECRTLLEHDLGEHNAGMLSCVKVPMDDHVHAALLSFTFNVGVQNFCTSALVRKLNAGDTAGACAELSRWVNAGGRQLPGLVKRRAAERELCERGVG